MFIETGVSSRATEKGRLAPANPAGPRVFDLTREVRVFVLRRDLPQYECNIGIERVARFGSLGEWNV